LLLLLVKLDNIKKSLDKWEIIYSFEDFIHVLNIWLSVSINPSLSFPEVINEINKIYNSYQ
jgi:hypothetical protein